MARSTMVVSVTRGRMGFTVSDASREWELAVFVSEQSTWLAFVVVLTQMNGVCYSTSRTVQRPDDVTNRIVNAVAWMCKSWDEMDRESIKQVIRRQLSK